MTTALHKGMLMTLLLTMYKIICVEKLMRNEEKPEHKYNPGSSCQFLAGRTKPPHRVALFHYYTTIDLLLAKKNVVNICLSLP